MGEEYRLGMSSNSLSLQRITIFIVILLSFTYYFANQGAQLRTLKYDLREKALFLEEKERYLQEKETEINLKEQEILKRDERLKSWAASVKNRHERLEQRIADYGKGVEKLRLREEKLEEKTREVEVLEERSIEKENELLKLRNELLDKEGQIIGRENEIYLKLEKIADKELSYDSKKAEKRKARSLNVGYTLKSREEDIEMLTIFFQSFLLSVPAYTFRDFVFVTNTPISQRLDSVIPPFARIHHEVMPSLIEKMPGYSHQQWTGFYADKFLNSAFVGILDSDLVFHSTITSRKIFTESGKLIVLRRKCIVDDEYKCPRLWNRGSKYLLGEKLTYNYMVNLPFYFPIDMLDPFRKFVEKRTNTTFDQAFFNVGNNLYNLCHICFLGTFMQSYQPWRYEFVDVPYPTLSEHAGWTVKYLYHLSSKFGNEYLDVSSTSLSRSYCNRFDVKYGYIPPYCKNYTIPVNQVEEYSFTWEGTTYGYDTQLTNVQDYYKYEDSFTIPFRPNDNEIIFEVQEVEPIFD